MSQELSGFVDPRQFLIVNGGMQGVAEQGQPQVRGNQAAGGSGAFKVRPMPGFGQDTQLSRRPFIGNHAGIAERDGVIFCTQRISVGVSILPMASLRSLQRMAVKQSARTRPCPGWRASLRRRE